MKIMIGFAAFLAVANVVGLCLAWHYGLRIPVSSLIGLAFAALLVLLLAWAEKRYG